MDDGRDAHQELARWLSGVNAFITAVNRPASLRELLDLVTATACELLGYDFCGVLLVRPEQRRLMMEGAHGLSHEYVAQLNDAVPLSITADGKSESPSTRAFLSARPVVVNDVLGDPLMKPWHTLAQQQGYRSIVSVPLLLKGRPFGVLNCYSAERNGISDSSVELLSILANQVAAAIEAIHLRDEQRANIDSLAQANDSLRRQSRLLEQAQEMHKRLNDVALGAGGLEDVCHALAEILDRPVVIDDVHGRLLAPAASLPDGFPSTSALILDEAAADIGEMTMEADAGPHSLTVVPIRVADELVARIWVDCRLHELTDLDRRALENATVIVALEILRLRAAQDVEWRVQGDIVDVLVHGHPSEFPSLVARAEALGHDLRVPHRMVLLAFPGEAEPGAALAGPGAARAIKQTVTSVLDAVSPRPLIAVDDGRVIVLVPASDEADEAGEPVGTGGVPDQLDRIHRTIARRHGWATLALIGPVCSAPEDYARALRMVRGAMVLQEKRGGGAGTVALADLGLISLLLQVEEPGDLDSFSTRALGPLREHDSSKSGALEETLRAYFHRGCNVTDTSADLFVHPNTVKMRLRKIERLLGRDLSDPEDVLNLRAALLIDEVIQAGPRRQ